MEKVLIILAILWLVIPIAAKKRQQKAKAEQEAARAAKQRAPQSAVQQRAPEPMRTTPLSSTMRTAQQATIQPSYEGLGSQEGRSGAVLQGERAHEVSVNLTQAKSTLTQAGSSIQHVVTVSSQSGHAHQETSMTGIRPDCPPDQPPVDQAVQAVGGESAFLWDVADARKGLVMAEILGPCLALRDS